MFTGIIETTGKILSIKKNDNRAFCHILPSTPLEDIKIGESIAIDGICLSVTNINQDNSLSFDLSKETLTTTIAQFYTNESLVHIERAVRMNDRLGGHIVTGHIDTIGYIKNITQYRDISSDTTECMLYKVTACCPTAFHPYIFPKGSICINGVSLTINTVSKEKNTLNFSFMLIPITLTKTNCKSLVINAPINIECDWAVKAIVHSTEITRQLMLEKENSINNEKESPSSLSSFIPHQEA